MLMNVRFEIWPHEFRIPLHCSKILMLTVLENPVASVLAFILCQYPAQNPGTSQ